MFEKHYPLNIQFSFLIKNCQVAFYYKVIMYQHKTHLFSTIAFIMLAFSQISYAYAASDQVKLVLANNQIPTDHTTSNQISLDTQKTQDNSKVQTSTGFDSVKTGINLSGSMKLSKQETTPQKDETAESNLKSESNTFIQNQEGKKSQLIQIIPRSNDVPKVISTVQETIKIEPSSLKTNQKSLLPSVQKRVHRQHSQSVLGIFWKELLIQFKSFDKNQNVQIPSIQTFQQQQTNNKQEVLILYSSKEAQNIRRQKRKQFVSFIIVFGVLTLLFVKIAKIRQESEDKKYAKYEESPEQQDERLSNHK